MKKITINAIIKSDIDKVWEFWNSPNHITKWAFASDDWEAPRAENDLRKGGRFVTKMSAKDGSSSFDFSGVYTNVDPKEKIEYTMDDNRTVVVEFKPSGENSVEVIEEFEMENENSEEMQRAGWQSILDNFKKYVENS